MTIINYFNPEDIVSGAFITNDGSVISNVDFYHSKNFIPVNPNETFIVPFTVKQLGAEYDSNGTFIRYLNREQYVQPYTDKSVFTSSATTGFVKVNGYKGTSPNYVSTPVQEFMLIKGDVYPSQYIPYINPEIHKDVLHGKVLGCAGTSITFGANASIDLGTGERKTYGWYTSKRHEMTYHNYGVSGSTMAFINTGKEFSYNRYKQLADDLDYLTIEFGWNDFAYATLGTISDTSNITFYGAWNVVMEYLINKYPKTKIGLIVPYGTNVEWRNAVRLIGKKWGVPYLDLMSEDTPLFYDKEPEIGLNPAISAARKAVFFADGVHPNDVGYQYLSTIYEDFLRKL